MQATICLNCGAKGYGWSRQCWKCGYIESIKPEIIAAAETEVSRVARESAKIGRCRESVP
jgi:predicted ATP-dependent serine protease